MVVMLSRAAAAAAVKDVDVHAPVAMATVAADISGYYHDPSTPGCSVLIELATLLEYTSDSDRSNSAWSGGDGRGKSSTPGKTEKKKKKKKKKKGSEDDGSRQAMIFRSLPGDGEEQCYFNNSDMRLAPIPSVIRHTMSGEGDGGGGDIKITSDFSALGGSATRQGVFRSGEGQEPPQLVWEADSSLRPTSAAAVTVGAETVWLKLPFSGFYSDSRFPGCRRQVLAETLWGARLAGADAQSQTRGCNGRTDVLWQNSQELRIQGLQVTAHYSRRYTSYSQEAWEQMRNLQREEANALNGRALDDPRGDWWDREETVSGAMQLATGSIHWEDGSVWARLDSRGHLLKPLTAPLSMAPGSGNAQQQAKEVEVEEAWTRDRGMSSRRRQAQVQQLREKAIKHSLANKQQTQKQEEKRQLKQLKQQQKKEQLQQQQHKRQQQHRRAPRSAGSETGDNTAEAVLEWGEADHGPRGAGWGGGAHRHDDRTQDEL